jgi:hypothetical protein
VEPAPEISIETTGEGARLRLAHLSPDAGALDIYLNGDRALTALRFNTITPWVELAPGTYRLGFAPADGDVFRTLTLRVEEGQWLTAAAYGLANGAGLEVAQIDEDYTPLAADTARVTVFHAIENAPPLDVVLGGRVIVSALAFPGAAGDNDGVFTTDVRAGTYPMRVIRAGTAARPAVILELGEAALAAGSHLFIGVAGTSGAPSAAVAFTEVAE